MSHVVLVVVVCSFTAAAQSCHSLDTVVFEAGPKKNKDLEIKNMIEMYLETKV